MEAPTNDFEGAGGSQEVANPMEAPIDDFDPSEAAGSGRGEEEAMGVKETSNATKEISKATKADDAEVAVEEWDKRLAAGLGLRLDAEAARAATTLLSWGLRWWKRRQTQGFFSWLHQR
jgi:hypothetical protein